jgi:hypothetical protein
MAFRREYTPIREVGQLGYAAGVAERRKREQEFVVRAQELAEKRKHERELAEHSAQIRMDLEKQAQSWEAQKMIMRSQADFARMEQKRQNDFELQERKRIRELEDLDMKRKLIEESDTLTASEKDRALVELIAGVRIPVPKVLDPMEQLIAQMANLNNVGEAAEPGAFGEPLLKKTPAQSPYPEYPDAFFENGAWKVIRDGKKYRIEE